jgi:hypothetical protein
MWDATCTDSTCGPRQIADQTKLVVRWSPVSRFGSVLTPPPRHSSACSPSSDEWLVGRWSQRPSARPLTVDRSPPPSSGDSGASRLHPPIASLLPPLAPRCLEPTARSRVSRGSRRRFESSTPVDVDASRRGPPIAWSTVTSVQAGGFQSRLTASGALTTEATAGHGRCDATFTAAQSSRILDLAASSRYAMQAMRAVQETAYIIIHQFGASWTA